MSDAQKVDSVIVCRCEEVTLADVERAVADGYAAPELLKRATRVSMGACQGRVCRPMLRAFWRARARGTDDDRTDAHAVNARGHVAERRDSRGSLPVGPDLDLPGSRPPVRPIRVGDLAELDPPDEPVTPSQGNR
jgi:bacterioferritin-associated ferredoxin